MGLLVFVKDYFIWHYSRALQEGFVIWDNYLRFISQFFSIGLLFRTLFSPWRRLKEYYSRGFDPTQYFDTLVINLVMRFVGFILRFATIIIGLCVELIAIITGTILFVVWLTLPFFIILCFSRGIMLFAS